MIIYLITYLCIQEGSCVLIGPPSFNLSFLLHNFVRFSVFSSLTISLLSLFHYSVTVDIILHVVVH